MACKLKVPSPWEKYTETELLGAGQLPAPVFTATKSCKPSLLISPEMRAVGRVSPVEIEVDPASCPLPSPNRTRKLFLPLATPISILPSPLKSPAYNCPNTLPYGNSWWV